MACGAAPKEKSREQQHISASLAMSRACRCGAAWRRSASAEPPPISATHLSPTLRGDGEGEGGGGVAELRRVPERVVGLDGKASGEGH